MTTSLPDHDASLAIVDRVGAKDHAREIVRASGTSFGFGMRILPAARREGMYAVYAFCREVDDIADDDGRTPEDRQRALDEWRAEIDRVYAGNPQSLTGQALVEPIARFDLDKEEFILVIEGMEMDAHGPIVAPSMDTLFAYTRRAAGAVGQLSMPIFGAPKTDAARTFALSLGDALQITNILRDVAEDARIGRIYLPRDLLDRYQVPADPARIVGAPGLPLVARDLGETVRARFATVRAALAHLDWRVLRPALLMMGVYERYFQRLEARGWDKIGTPLSLSKPEKLLISTRYGLFPPLKAAPAFPGASISAGDVRGG
ncbi:MAG: presqualene diphosphate synthase HpnD [Pseudomonadota bacterium]